MYINNDRGIKRENSRDRVLHYRSCIDVYISARVYVYHVKNVVETIFFQGLQNYDNRKSAQ